METYERSLRLAVDVLTSLPMLTLYVGFFAGLTVSAVVVHWWQTREGDRWAVHRARELVHEEAG